MPLPSYLSKDQLRAIAHYHQRLALGIPNQSDATASAAFVGRDPYTGRSRVQLTSGGHTRSRNIASSSYTRGAIAGSFNWNDKGGWLDQK